MATNIKLLKVLVLVKPLHGLLIYWVK